MKRLKIILVQNGTFVALLALIVFFASMNPRFLSLSNAQTILLQIAELGLIALPLAFLVMSGTLDLSVGSVASLAAIVSAKVMVENDSPWLGLASAVGVGLVAGALNGFLVAYLKMNALVITLGFLSVWGGMALFLTNGATISGLPDSFTALGTQMFGPVSLQIVILVLFTAAAWYLLNRMPIGRNILAIGGNSRAAHLMGIQVPRTRFLLFVLTSVSAALAGVLLSAKLHSATPSVGSGMEIQALTVVLLGGVALEGGAGRIGGVIAGLLFVGVLRNGLVILGVSQFLQTIFIGATLVVAVVLDGSMQQLLKRTWSSIAVSERSTQRARGAASARQSKV